MVGVFSLVANLLMLSPTLYMLQVYDRVMVSRSELTLLMVSLIVLLFFAIMALAEWSARACWCAPACASTSASTRVFNAGFRADLSKSGHRPGAGARTT